MAEQNQPHPPVSRADTVAVVLRGYFSRTLPTGLRTATLPLAEAPTPRAAIARLGVPAAAVGLLLVNKEMVNMDTPLSAGDTLEVLPLMGGGGQRCPVVRLPYSARCRV